MGIKVRAQNEWASERKKGRKQIEMASERTVQ